MSGIEEAVLTLVLFVILAVFVIGIMAIICRGEQ